MDALDSRKVRLLTAEVAGLRSEIDAIQSDLATLWGYVQAVHSDVDWASIRQRNFLAAISAAVKEHGQEAITPRVGAQRGA